METVAEAVELGLATLAARTTTLGGFGMTAGAVYKPVAEIVPTAALPPATPLTFQVTDVFALPLTVEVNCCVAAGASVTVVGAMPICTGGGGGGTTGGAVVTLNCTAAVVTTPLPVFVTVTGSFVPACAAVAVPVATIPVAETSFEVTTTPPTLTTEFAA